MTKRTLAGGDTKQLSAQKVGYARVSTEAQDLETQRSALTRAGCTRIFADKRSGKNTDRPELKLMMKTVQPGDIIVVTRLDRLARSVSDLIKIAETLKNKSVQLCSLAEAIDTTTAGGSLLFHIMSAMAEFERALISERTKAKLQAIKDRNIKLGNTALQSNDPAVRDPVIKKLRQASERRFLAQIETSEAHWLSHVEFNRPEKAWKDVARIISATTPFKIDGPGIRRTALAYVKDGRLPASVLNRAPKNSALLKGPVRLAIDEIRINPAITTRELQKKLIEFGYINQSANPDEQKKAKRQGRHIIARARQEIATLGM